MLHVALCTPGEASIVVDGENIVHRIHAVLDKMISFSNRVRTGSLQATHPSNTLLAERVTPETLVKLVALFELSVFTQGVIWNIDSFDQWSVELGKVLAQRILPELDTKTEPTLKHDSSTNTLIRRYRKLKGKIR